MSPPPFDPGRPGGPFLLSRAVCKRLAAPLTLPSKEGPRNKGEPGAVHEKVLVEPQVNGKEKTL